MNNGIADPEEAEPSEAGPVTYWHGGGKIDGPLLLPGTETGISRSGDTGVHVTTDRVL